LFFRAEDGIRDFHVTGVHTCALPIFEAGVHPDEIIAGWADDLAAFDELADGYRLYDLSIDRLREALDEHVTHGDGGGPVLRLLTTALDQAERHLAAGRSRQAQGALDRFVQHLDHPKRSAVLTDEAAEHLRALALQVRSSLDG